MHNKSIQTLILLVTILILTGCNSFTSKTDLTGEWILVSYGPKNSPIAATGDARNSLKLSQDGTLAGNVGCNSFSGVFSSTNDQIKFGAIASTMMACPVPIMQQESTVFTVLNGTTSFTLINRKMTILNGDMMVVFEKQ